MNRIMFVAILVLATSTLVLAEDNLAIDYFQKEQVRLKKEIAAFPGWIAAQEKMVEEALATEQGFIQKVSALKTANPMTFDDTLTKLREAVEKRVRAQMKLDELKQLYAHDRSRFEQCKNGEKELKDYREKLRHKPMIPEASEE